MLEPKVISNLEVHKDHVIVSVNPKIYPLDIVYSACYVMLDKAFIFLSGDPEAEVLIELRYKDGKGELETLGRTFNNELLNYAVFKAESAGTQSIRDSLVQKAINSSTIDLIEDPLGIAKPWEETNNG